MTGFVAVHPVERTRSLLRATAFLLFVTGLASVLTAAAIAMGEVSRDTEVVLSDVQTLLAFEDRLVLAIPAFARVQAYSRNGEFLYGWSINAQGGEFWARRHGSELEIVTVRNRRIYRYDLEGRLLEAAHVDNPMILTPKLTDHTKDGQEFRFRRHLGLIPMIERRASSNANWVVVLSQPIGAVFGVPHPSMEFTVLGIGLLVVTRYLGEKKN